jgi:hypothetical protein
VTCSVQGSTQRSFWNSSLQMAGPWWRCHVLDGGKENFLSEKRKLVGREKFLYISFSSEQGLELRVRLPRNALGTAPFYPAHRLPRPFSGSHLEREVTVHNIPEKLESCRPPADSRTRGFPIRYRGVHLTEPSPFSFFCRHGPGPASCKPESHYELKVC